MQRRCTGVKHRLHMAGKELRRLFVKGRVEICEANTTRAVFRIFCKGDFCGEVRDFKISEPEAEGSHRRRRLGLDGLSGKMLR